jgi:hypothetical protein
MFGWLCPSFWSVWPDTHPPANSMITVAIARYLNFKQLFIGGSFYSTFLLLTAPESAQSGFLFTTIIKHNIKNLTALNSI